MKSKLKKKINTSYKAFLKQYQFKIKFFFIPKEESFKIVFLTSFITIFRMIQYLEDINLSITQNFFFNPLKILMKKKQ